MLSAADSFKAIESELERCGYTVVQNFVDGGACTRLAAECRALYAAGQLSPAAVSRGNARSEHTHIRGDRTRWFDSTALAPAQSLYWRRMEELRIDLNRTLLLGLEDLEAHYALYPAGTRYARHRDRFRDDDARMLSSVLYLNPAWRCEDGGALRLYMGAHAQNPYVDIYPSSGTLVLFLSADFDHEVLPATRERLSIAGWFRRSG
jgi:SM-20-related protein